MRLQIQLGTKQDLEWAQETVTQHHYLHCRVHNQARPMAYIISYQGQRLGLVIAGGPHATKNKSWWGYDDLPTKWQVVDLSRIWISPRIQKGGDLCKPDICPGFIGWRGRWWPAVASWAIGEVLARVQRDRISLWPPVFIDQPYHIRLVISYHDPAYHQGNLYRKASAVPMYTDGDEQPVPGPSGKYGWCWPLPEPAWTWEQIEIRRPRTMRLAF